MTRIYITILLIVCSLVTATGQINTDQVTRVGRNALYFEDYVLAIQYFNQVIAAKPYLAHPYFYRGVAKYNLDDFKGAEEDASIAIEHNPYITDAYELRGAARQNLGRNSAAIEDYDKALSMLPENRSIMFNKALAQIEMKDHDGAAASFDRLLAIHPRFDAGYLGRARLELAMGDTVKASEDISRAIEINKNSVNAYVMRADIAINRNQDYQQALADMDEAIRLQPKYAGFFINRAFLRHKIDDYFGAMSDYDYAIQLEPTNAVALYNRALLRAEVHDFNKSIADLNQVLALKGTDYRTLYNRSVIYKEMGDYKAALADVNKVIEAFPNLAAAYFLRYDIKREMGDRTANKDFDYSLALAKERVKTHPDDRSVGTDAFNIASDEADGTDTQEAVAAQFSTLLTISDNANVEQEYNNKSIRGKVQDRNMQIDIEPMFVLTYYSAPTELKPSSEYMREVDDLNRSRTLNFVLQVTNHEPTLSDADAINRHFESIEYYNSYLATHAPRAVDYFGRGMDLMTIHNYSSAIEDFNRAIEASPEFIPAYFMRAIARYREITSNVAEEPADKTKDAMHDMAGFNSRRKMQEVMEDIDKVIKLSPTMALAYYNKGVLLVEMGDYTSALSAFTQAIERKADFGEAYYNRGFVYLRLGNRESGLNDLSKAGELGIVPSYNLLKRMSR